MCWDVHFESSTYLKVTCSHHDITENKGLPTGGGSIPTQQVDKHCWHIWASCVETYRARILKNNPNHILLKGIKIGKI